MEQYIPKAAIIAKLKTRRKEWSYGNSTEAKYKSEECDDILSIISNLEVKEVDLEKEVDNWYNTKASKEFENVLYSDIEKCAKHFFELGMAASNPITATDRGTAEEIIINLKRVEQDYHINLTREMEWLRNQVKKEK